MPPSLSSVSKIVSGRMPRFTIASNVALADKMDDRILVGVPFGRIKFICLSSSDCIFHAGQYNAHTGSSLAEADLLRSF